MNRMCCLAAIFLMAAIPVANAALITKHVEFSISGNGPVSPVIGSYTISLDPTQSYADASAGLVMNSLNLTVNSPILFDYLKNSDILVIGGSTLTNTGITVGDFDFYFAVNNFTTAPQFGGLAYVQGGPLNFFVIPNGAVVNQLSVTDVQEVPEPATLSLFGAGVAGALAMRRRRKARAA